MGKELVIGSNRHETKVAILEDDQLVEIYFQRANEYSLAGSIHKGRVTRVLPGMQSAFVDLGLERDTFLYVSDFFEENEDFEPLGDEKVDRDRGNARSSEQRLQTTGERHQAPVERTPQPELSAGPIHPAGGETATAQATAAMPEVDDEVDTSGAAELRAGFDEPTASATERGEGDRGDRRGRRSRRRRSRGRGFPDTKYAQPSGRPEAGPTEESATIADDEPGDDVIILPGESLAKYREKQPHAVQLPPHGEMGAVEPAPAAEPLEPSHLLDEVESSQEEHEVLGDDDPPPVARSAAGVRTDSAAVPASKALALEEDLARAEERANTVAAKALALRADEPVTAAASGPAMALDTGEPSAPFEEEVEAIQAAAEAAVRDDRLAAEEVLEAEGLDQELEALEDASDDEASPSAEAPAEFDAAPGQTAAVREPGSGRYLQHRSRRMRRRRGGRLTHPSGVGSHAGASPGHAAAAAPALQPDEQTERAAAGRRPERGTPSIADLLKPGQEIIVQIAKEPLGQKGARITSHIALPGRYVVFMPSVEHMGVSRKIASDEERQRLKRILLTHRSGAPGGFIVRTAGEGRSEEEIAADMNFLYSLWMDIRQKAEKKPAPLLLHHDLDVVQRILRDHVTDSYKAIWADTEEMYESVLRFVQRFQPSLVGRVKLYTRSAPIFDAFNISNELEKALRPKVWLKSGGYIVINQTEALVAIDINTGKYVGKSNRLEDTIVKTNVEAVKEIVRQIRLRDLGGIIVVDFIDMDERRNRQKVMQALEEAMRADKAPNKILQFNDFGLVAITRKRVKQSLERTLCSPCPYCEGAGYVKSVQTIIGEILIEAQKLARAIEGKDVVLRVHPDVARELKSNTNRYLEELEQVLGRPVLVKGDPTLHHEKFDLA